MNEAREIACTMTRKAVRAAMLQGDNAGHDKYVTDKGTLRVSVLFDTDTCDVRVWWTLNTAPVSQAAAVRAIAERFERITRHA